MKRIIILLSIITFSLFVYSQENIKLNIDLNVNSKNELSTELLVIDQESIQKSEIYNLWLNERKTDTSWVNDHKNLLYSFNKDFFEISVECFKEHIPCLSNFEIVNRDNIIYFNDKNGDYEIILNYMVKYKNDKGNIIYNKIHSIFYLLENDINHNCYILDINYY